MRIDYFKVMKESFDFTIKNKALWLFGFFLALFAGGSSNGNFNSGSYNGGSSSSSTKDMSVDMQNFTNKANDMIVNTVHQPIFWIIVAILIVLALVLIAVGVYLTNISTTALIKAVQYDLAGKQEKITIKNLWNDSTDMFWQVFLYRLVFGLLMGLAIIIFIVPIFLMAILPILLCLLIIWIPLMVVVLYAMSTTYSIGLRMVVFKKTDIMEAFKSAFNSLKTQLKDWFVGSLAAILPNLAFGILSIFVIILLALIFVGLPALAIFAAHAAIWTVALLVVGVLLFILSMAAVEAPFQVFESTYWTKLYILIVEQNSAQSSAVK